jgi:hypothetical protein
LGRGVWEAVIVITTLGPASGMTQHPLRFSINRTHCYVGFCTRQDPKQFWILYQQDPELFWAIIQQDLELLNTKNKLESFFQDNPLKKGGPKHSFFQCNKIT